MLRCAMLALLLLAPAAGVAQAPPALRELRGALGPAGGRRRSHPAVNRLRGAACLLALCATRLSGQARVFYASGSVDEPPRRLSGPPVEYPRALLVRHVQGVVRVAAIVDTSGRVEPASVEVLSTPDSGLNNAVKQMMLASQFSAGRPKGAAVRVLVPPGV